MQDIPTQNEVVDELRSLFPSSTVIDRRERPSHGYRAVHVIPVLNGKPVEVQVRTLRQHLWANLSESLADRFDPEIKYGGGPADIRASLRGLSDVGRRLELYDLSGTPSGREVGELIEFGKVFRDAISVLVERIRRDVEKGQ